MIFRQITHDDLGCASYLIGDEDAGVAAVVDPKLEIDEYLRLARYLGVRIEHVLETHNHADHVSGHGRLVAVERRAGGDRLHHLQCGRVVLATTAPWWIRSAGGPRCRPARCLSRFRITSGWPGERPTSRRRSTPSPGQRLSPRPAKSSNSRQ